VLSPLPFYIAAGAWPLLGKAWALAGWSARLLIGNFEDVILAFYGQRAVAAAGP
jgi:hypothetical protein